MFKYIWTYFTSCSIVSDVNFEHVIAGWGVWKVWILVSYKAFNLASFNKQAALSYQMKYFRVQNKLGYFVPTFYLSIYAFPNPNVRNYGFKIFLANISLFEVNNICSKLTIKTP